MNSRKGAVGDLQNDKILTDILCRTVKLPEQGDENRESGLISLAAPLLVLLLILGNAFEA
jgi:hypothetical protein